MQTEFGNSFARAFFCVKGGGLHFCLCGRVRVCVLYVVGYTYATMCVVGRAKMGGEEKKRLWKEPHIILH